MYYHLFLMHQLFVGCNAGEEKKNIQKQAQVWSKDKCALSQEEGLPEDTQTTAALLLQ